MNTKPLKLISLNIEQDRHLDRVSVFLTQNKPDIVLFQEILEKDLSYFENLLQMQFKFAPLNYLHHQNGAQKLGIATFTALPLNTTYGYYRGSENNLPLIRNGEPEKMARALLFAEIIKNNARYLLVNTHFTWSPNAKPSPQQEEDLKKMLTMLEEYPEFIFCGDFNAPRGTKIFDSLSALYQDNIPRNITTTIDKNLHKAGDLNIVVDGLFTTKQYQVRTIEVINGVSDHCALLAEIY